MNSIVTTTLAFGLVLGLTGCEAGSQFYEESLSSKTKYVKTTTFRGVDYPMYENKQNGAYEIEIENRLYPCKMIKGKPDCMTTLIEVKGQKQPEQIKKPPVAFESGGGHES